MSRYQQYKGNPEEKLVVTFDDFSGGVNLMDSDDLMRTDNFRYGLNVDLDRIGDLDSREGWGESGGLSDLLALVKDSPGYPKLGYDAGNQISGQKTIKLSKLEHTYLDISHFIQGDAVTFGFSDPNMIGNVVSGNVQVVIVDDLYNPTFEEAATDVENFTYYRTNPEVKVSFVPTKNFQPTYDRGRQQLFAALKVIMTDGQATDGNMKDVYFVQGELSTFKDTANDILLFKIINNPSNVWERIIDASSLYEITRGYSARRDMLTGSDYLQFIIIYTDKDDIIQYFLASVALNTEGATKHMTETGSFDTTYYNYNKSGHLYGNMMDITYGYDKDTLFFNGGSATAQDKGMISLKFNDVGKPSFNMVTRYIGGPTSDAYKPSPLEIRRVGFNVLGKAPLTWIDSQGISTKAVQGVYLTTFDDIPTNIIPMGKKFKLNIIYTGDITQNFEIKLHEMKNDEKVEITTEILEPVKVPGLHSYTITLLTQPVSEVEFEITNPDATTMGTYRDYYDMGQVHPNAKPVESLKIAEYGIANVWDRYVYYKGDTLWYSDVGRFDYVPNLNYITLPLSKSDEITNIIFFRQSYIIFTKERIYKMVGHFASPDLAIDLVNETLGCIAPNSVQMVNNQLYFLSTQGIQALKSETFRQDLENVNKIDEKLGEIVPKGSYLYSYSDDKQYALLLNENYTREILGDFENSMEIHGRSFKKPDVIRYYYESESFVFDTYDKGFYPRFIFNASGRMLGWHGDKFYVKGNSHKDFDHPFEFYLETSASTFGYASHEKKYKQLMLKLGQQSDKLDVKVKMFVDGRELHEDTKWASDIIEEIAHENSRFTTKRMRIPSLKGKNLAVALSTTVNDPVSVKTLSYTFKLGKMRE